MSSDKTVPVWVFSFGWVDSRVCIPRVGERPVEGEGREEGGAVSTMDISGRGDDDSPDAIQLDCVKRGIGWIGGWVREPGNVEDER